MMDKLKAADANGDGYIDRAEADARLPRVAKNFDQLDANQDGKLSNDELREAANMARQRFRR
jgi:Ca2+-binding EF-hand superfamily protein